MSTEELLYDVKDEIGTVTFNRPQARNALTFGMYEALADICENAPTDGSVKAIIIRGSGEKAFAAGTDISLFKDFSPEKGVEYEKGAERYFSAVARCPLPTIAAISGACTGGGAGIAGVCDMRIASRDLKFGFPISRTLGNTLSADTLSRMVNLIGEAKVIDLIYTSRLIEADEALHIGLVNELQDDCDAVMERAWALATRLKQHAPLTMRSIKTILRRLREAQPKVEDQDVIGEVYGSDDFREGMEAFLAKRRPNWTGK
jgi:enoyl-CoA hydratase